MLRRAARDTESAVDSAFDFSRATLVTIGLAAVGIASFAGFLASAERDCDAGGHLQIRPRGGA